MKEKEFYKKEDVLKTVMRDRRWDEVIMLTGDEISPVFEWSRMVDMIVWSQDDECYKVVTYPVDLGGLLRNDVAIMDWEMAIGGHAIDTALTDECFGSPYEALNNLHDHVCNDIDVRGNKVLRDTLCDYLCYLMDAAGYGRINNVEIQKANLRECKKLWDWQQRANEK